MELIKDICFILFASVLVIVVAILCSIAIALMILVCLSPLLIILGFIAWVLLRGFY